MNETLLNIILHTKEETYKQRKDRRDKEAKELFYSLHNEGLKVAKGKVVRMRYDDALKLVAYQFHLSVHTVEQIVKGVYRK